MKRHSQKRVFRVVRDAVARQISGSPTYVTAAVLVGLLSAAGVWLFKQMINWVHQGAFGIIGGELGKAGHWTVFLVPTLGGLLVGLLMHFVVGKEKFHGIAGVMEAVALAGGRMPYLQAPMKAVAAALSIGTGASVGPEDPSVQIGANLGSLFGQKLRLSDQWVRSLVAAGAAAGIAAAFNAPIAGVFFALEIVLGEISGTSLGAVVLAAVISSVFTQSVSGTQPAFHVGSYALHSAAELPLYLGLGLLAGPLAALYVYSLFLAKDFFTSWRIPNWLKPASAGLAVGLIGIYLPQVFGVGYDTIEGILGSAQMSIQLLIGLVIAKMALTSLCIGAGFPGGVFAPSLFLGAALGGAYGLVMQKLFPSLLIAPPAFAMIGMAAVLAGAVHAPLTAILLLFEMTNDYRIILPLMFAVIVSLLISQRLREYSVYTLSLARRGLHLERGRDVEVLEGITVSEVMEPDPPVLDENLRVPEAASVFAQTRHHGLLVVDASGALVGVLTLQDLERAGGVGAASDKTVTDICTKKLLVAFPDESIGTALQRMSARDIGRLPVVERDRPSHLLGVLRRPDLIRAYDVALTRRARMRHHAHQTHLDVVAGAGVRVQELVVERGAPCDGKQVCDVVWPRDSVIASLRRGRRVLIPHGDTVLRAGDVLVTVAEGEAYGQIREICSASQNEQQTEI